MTNGQAMLSITRWTLRERGRDGIQTSAVVRPIDRRGTVVRGRVAPFRLAHWKVRRLRPGGMVTPVFRAILAPHLTAISRGLDGLVGGDAKLRDSGGEARVFEERLGG